MQNGNANTIPLPIVLILFGGLLIGLIYFTVSWLNKTNAHPDTLTLNEIISNEDESMSDEFINSEINYSFNYPTGSNIIIDDLQSGGYIDDYSVRFGHLSSDIIADHGEFDTKELSKRLSCDADGMQSSIRCVGMDIKPFVTESGVGGYHAIRKQLFIGSDTPFPEGEYDTDVYIFPLPIDEESEDIQNNAFLTITIDIPNEENKIVLEKIANSVKVF